MARYRRHRTDFHSHRATAGLSSLARDLMWYAIERGGLLGVVEHSPRRLASVVGSVAPGLPCTVDHVEAALAELVASGAAVWWSELETLWIVECADEQAKGAKAEDGCRSQLSELPGQVAESIAKRYPRLSGRGDESYQGVGGEPSPHTAPAPAPVSDPVPAAPPAVEPPTMRVVSVSGDPDVQLAAKLAEAACLAHVDHRAPRGLFATAVECQEHGAPLDEILEVLAKHAVDTSSSRPDRVRMLWSTNWPSTRERYLGTTGPPGERRDPLAEARARLGGKTWTPEQETP